MPRKKRAPYMCVDLDLMTDPQVRKLARKLGRGAVLLWLEILMRFHEYGDYDFMVPMEDLDDFKEGYFLATSEDVEKVMGMAASFGWLQIWKNDLGEEFLYSPRRQADLRQQRLVHEAQSKGAEDTNQKLGRGNG